MGHFVLVENSTWVIQIEGSVDSDKEHEKEGTSVREVNKIHGGLVFHTVLFFEIDVVTGELVDQSIPQGATK